MHLTPTERWRDDAIELFVLTPDAVSDAYVGWLNDPEINQYLESRFVVQDRRLLTIDLAKLAIEAEAASTAPFIAPPGPSFWRSAGRSAAAPQATPS